MLIIVYLIFLFHIYLTLYPPSLMSRSRTRYAEDGPCYARRGRSIGDRLQVLISTLSRTRPIHWKLTVSNYTLYYFRVHGKNKSLFPMDPLP